MGSRRLLLLGAAGSFFFDVLDRELAQHAFDELAHHAQLMVAGNGLQVPPVSFVNTAPTRPLARLNHVEYGNMARVAGERISALDPVARLQQASRCKSLEDLGQCFMGQSVEFCQVSGAERTLPSVLR